MLVVCATRDASYRCARQARCSYEEAWLSVQVGKFAFVANSRARSVDDTEGLVKFISDKKTDKILGAHIMGPNAGNDSTLLHCLIRHNLKTALWGLVADGVSLGTQVQLWLCCQLMLPCRRAYP